MLQRYRYSFILLKQLVKTEFKLRYQGSVLGYMWSLLKPMLLFVILYFVFSEFLKVGDNVPNFPVYLLLGIVLWSFFSETTGTSLRSIVERGDILRKINFPKYVVVLSVAFSAFINLFLNMIVVFIFMEFAQVDMRWEGMLFPIVIAQLFAVALSVSFFLSAVYVKFRDISHIWEVVLQGAFYATPILYPVTMIPESAARILMLSPMAQIIQDMRYLLITDKTLTIDAVYDGNHLIRIIPYSITIGMVILSSWYFRKRSKFFAEEL